MSCDICCEFSHFSACICSSHGKLGLISPALAFGCPGAACPVVEVVLGLFCASPSGGWAVFTLPAWGQAALL